MRHIITQTTLTCACALLVQTSASAVPTVVQSQDLPNCDPLMPLSLVDELGIPPTFPADEAIDAVATFTNQSACPATDNPNMPNAIVRITNLTPFTFFDLHYVADPNLAVGGTSISNFDGIVNAGQAFRIDTLGVNRPLVSESILPDGLFQPGESWFFIVQDYTNTFGLTPAAFLSIGVGAASPGPPSSGSIIALIPEPASLCVVAIAGVTLLRRRPVVHETYGGTASIGC